MKKSKIDLSRRKYYESNKETLERLGKSKFNIFYKGFLWVNFFLKEIGHFGRFILNIFTFLIILQSFKWWFLNHRRVLNGGNNLVNLTLILLLYDFLIIIWIRWKTREPQGFGGM